MTFDEIRAAHPELGLALYAIDPSGVVTFEVHTPDGQVFAWRGPTEEAVLREAFPPEPPPPPPNVFD